MPGRRLFYAAYRISSLHRPAGALTLQEKNLVMKRTIRSLRKFQLNVDFFEDERIIGLQAIYGPAAPLAAIALLSIIHRHGYWAEWSDLVRFKLQSIIPDASPEYLDDVVGKMVEWGLFDSDMFHAFGVLTSGEIQRNYFRQHKRDDHTCPLPYLIGEQPLPAPTDNDSSGGQNTEKASEKSENSEACVAFVPFDVLVQSASDESAAARISNPAPQPETLPGNLCRIQSPAPAG